jgi:HEAT repeat protein
MFNWLRRLVHTKSLETQKHDRALAPEGGMTEVAIARAIPGHSRGQGTPDESDVADLMEQLARTNTTQVRLSAARSLGQLGVAATPAISALVNATVDVNETIREAALSALMTINPGWPAHEETMKAIPHLIAALNSHFSEVSAAALRVLHLIGPHAISDLAVALLSGEDTADKIYMMQVLARHGSNAVEAVPGLTRALGSQSLQVRIVAAIALTNIGPPAIDALPELVAGLADVYADGRAAMATCLACFGAAAEPAVPVLLPLLADRESRVRRAAATALQQIGSHAIPGLIAIIEARDVQWLKAWAESRVRALKWYTILERGIVAEPHKVVIAILWDVYNILEDRERLEAAQEAALQVLGKLGPIATAAVPVVTQALIDPNPDIRLAAACTLGQIGAAARVAIPALTHLLVSDRKPIREAAAKALESIDPAWASEPGVAGEVAGVAKQLSRTGILGEMAIDACVVLGEVAIPILIDMLETGDRVARENTAKALGRIGADARSAIPALNRVLEDDHPWVQREAAEALAKIR